MRYRIPAQANWPHQHVDRVICADALTTLRELPSECVALAATSPPYWDAVDYGYEGQIGQSTYEEYLQDALEVWKETARVLAPNGKLAIVTPILPIAKSQIGDQHTRHLKNIAFDIDASILSGCPMLKRYSLFVWKKQTTKKMFGSYPYPPNIYEDNTIEFITVYVKEGAPVAPPKEAKESSKLTQEEWRNLSMQIWPIYPEDVKRTGGHPAPFPVALPQRLIMMYTFAECRTANFAGDIVLDMFNGSGATTVAAKAMGRHWIGIDLGRDYCEVAERRLAESYAVNPRAVMLEDVRVRSAQDSRQQDMFASVRGMRRVGEEGDVYDVK